MSEVIGHTKGLCPKCLKTIPVTKVVEEDKIEDRGVRRLLVVVPHAPALLPRMERRLLEAWAVHTCDVFDRTGLQTALRVMEEVVEGSGTKEDRKGLKVLKDSKDAGKDSKDRG